MKLSIVFGACALLSNLASAQSAEEILKSPDWSKGSIVTDGAAVYADPDFDARVIEYLGYHAPIYVLKKAVPGKSGMGLFHRVRYKSKAGFVADTDLRMNAKEIEKQKEQDKTALGKKSEKKPDKKHRSQAWNEDDEAAMGPKPIYFTRYVGGELARVNFTEKFSGKKLSDQMFFGGLRFSGPGVLFDGPPLDVNILFTTQKPGYYKRITNGPVTGYMLMGDVAALFPLADGKSNLFYFGLGIMWTYTSYRVVVKNERLDSQEIRIGPDFDLGFAQRLGKTTLLRADAKYFWEKTQYYGLGLTVQTEY